MDSISSMLIYEKPEDVLGFLRSMVLFLKRIEITTIMTVEEGIHDENFIRGLHHLADGILEMRLAKELGKHVYYLRARKFLGLFSPTDWIKFEVTPKGSLLTKPHWHIKVDINKLEVSSALGKLEEGEFFKSLLKQLEEKSE
ncbi:MAG: hypothetical protein GTN80_02015 [Nitrososphaeria archaeon]|nr:hypothetical protein [Nitrososphaeria archaeon]